ncbi:MAG TPA: hypothetical protein VIJ30_09370 [Candidatus Dormibacteraeota bacterium]
MTHRRTTRSGSADDDWPTYLAPGFTADVVAVALDDRIAKGRDLVAQIDVHVYPQPGRADELNGKYWAWFNYNATYLERAFTTKELRTEFEGVFIGGIGRSESDLDRIRELAHDLQRDINKLIDIHGRLPLYEAPGNPREAATPAAAAPARRAPIHMTFQAPVGQVNFAEVIERADASIVQVDQRGEANLADGLRHLTNAIKAATEAGDDQREDGINAVGDLAEVGALPTEERGKFRARVRGAFLVIKELAAIAPSVKQALDAWGPTIREHLPHLPS